MNEFAGFVWLDFAPADKGSLVASLYQIYVLPEFRGLGLARMLFTRLCLFAYEQQIETLLIDVPGTADFLSPMFENEGARPMSKSFHLNVTAWHRDNAEAPD